MRVDLVQLFHSFRLWGGFAGTANPPQGFAPPSQGRDFQRGWCKDWRLPVKTNHEPIQVFLAQRSKGNLRLLRVLELSHQHAEERAF